MAIEIEEKRDIRTKVLQVFEHQSLHLGQDMFTQKHLDTLAIFYKKHGGKYYQLIHKGVRFRQYVGVIRVGDLTIEILPKADKNKTTNTGVWQQLLLDMLRECRLLKFDTIQAAALRLKRHSILDIYLENYVKAIEQVLRQGLLRGYQLAVVNDTKLKGQLLIAQQIRKNSLHQERFYTRQFQYAFDNPLNRILLAALNVAHRMANSWNLRARIQGLQAHFPKEISAYRATDFEKIKGDQRIAAYQEVLEIAYLILKEFGGDLRSGGQPILAILFDMNSLFEAYIYQVLHRLSNKDLLVKRQIVKPFWERRNIRPDILIVYKGERIILDTKWKVLTSSQAAMNDLKQVFIYCQYFNANKSVLIYPKVNDLAQLPAKPYHPFGLEKKTYYCQIAFAPVIKQNRLNMDLGAELLALLAENSRTV